MVVYGGGEATQLDLKILAAERLNFFPPSTMHCSAGQTAVKTAGWTGGDTDMMSPRVPEAR